MSARDVIGCAIHEHDNEGRADDFVDPVFARDLGAALLAAARHAEEAK